MRAIILILFLLMTQIGNGQFKLFQMGNIIYMSDDSFVHESARLCFAKFGKEKTTVMLDIRKGKEKPKYYLTYDNIYGNSIFNDIYKPKTWDHKLLGIRVYAEGNVTMEGIMKAVRKGINKKKKLRHIRRRIMRRDPEFRLSMQEDLRLRSSL